jgi:molybdopterin biosynthesis enzyme
MSYINTNQENESIGQDLATNQIIDFNSIVCDMLANKVLGRDFTFTISDKLSQDKQQRAKEIIDKFINLNQLDILVVELLKRTLKYGASVLTFRKFENSYLLEYNEPG